MEEFDYHVPGCTLGDKMRNVSMCGTASRDCSTCGWNEEEQKRRKALLKKNGLTKLRNGLMGLKI